MESSSNISDDKMIIDKGEFGDNYSYEYGSFLTDVNMEIINMLKRQLLNEETVEKNLTQKDYSYKSTKAVITDIKVENTDHNIIFCTDLNLIDYKCQKRSSNMFKKLEFREATKSNLDLNDSVNSLNLELRCTEFHVVVTTEETSSYNFYLYNNGNNSEVISALVVFNQHQVQMIKMKFARWWRNKEAEEFLPQLQVSHDDHKSPTIKKISWNKLHQCDYKNKMVADMIKFLAQMNKKSHLNIRNVELEKTTLSTITFDMASKSCLRHESEDISVERYRDPMNRTKLFFTNFASWQIQNMSKTMKQVPSSHVREYLSQCSIPKHLTYKYPTNVQPTWDQILLNCSLTDKLKHEITRKIIYENDPWTLSYSTLVKSYFKEFQNDKKKTRFLRL